MYDVNDPGLEHLTNKQIIGRALDAISESEEKEESDETQCAVKQVNHEEALRHIDGLIQYLEEQNDTNPGDEIICIFEKFLNLLSKFPYFLRKKK